MIAAAELDSAAISATTIAAEDPVSCIRHLHDRLHRHNLPFLPAPILSLNPTELRQFQSLLYQPPKALSIRAGVKRITPHCFRDTFACDMLARGASIFDVVKMLAGTVDTVEKHYASFVQAARDSAQHRMDNGLGI